MRTNVLLTATATALLAGAAVGHADTLAGGPLTPGNAQTLATCALFNTGPTDVPVASAAIVGLNGQPVDLIKNTCGTSPNASISAEEGCFIQAAPLVTNGNSSYTCVVTTTGSDAYVRGSLTIGTFGTPSIVAVPLQGPSP
jgi:hypothetical protein